MILESKNELCSTSNQRIKRAAVTGERGLEEAVNCNLTPHSSGPLFICESGLAWGNVDEDEEQ